MFGNVIEEKIPLGYSPKIGPSVVVEANHKGGDEIEFSSQVTEGTKCLDSLDYATNAKQRGDFCEHWYAVQIETKSAVPEKLGDVEKISCAAAKVEDALRARQIELDVTNPANIDGDPPVEIEIFPPIVRGLVDRVTPANLLESCGVDCFNNAFFLERKSVRPKRPERVLSRTGYSLAAQKLFYLVAESHITPCSTPQ
jgi:hypothetical protein